MTLAGKLLKTAVKKDFKQANPIIAVYLHTAERLQLVSARDEARKAHG